MRWKKESWRKTELTRRKYWNLYLRDGVILQPKFRLMQFQMSRHSSSLRFESASMASSRMKDAIGLASDAGRALPFARGGRGLGSGM